MIRATTTYDGETLVAVLARPNWANGSCDVTVATKTEIETTRHGKEYRRPSADKPIVSKISYTATLKGQDAQDWRTMQAFIGPKRVIVPVWPDARISAKFNPAHKTDYVIGWDVGFTNVAVGLRALPPDRDYLSSAIIGRLSIPDNDTVLNGVDGDVKVEVNNAEVMTFNWEEKPTITQQSEGGAYLAGETVNLFVVASGTQPITYQWYLDGEPISGATSAEYSFTMAEAYEGSYTCVASNALGSCESDAIAIAEMIVPYVENLIVGGGYNFAMFLDADGDLYCAGDNYSGNYGNGTDTPSSTFIKTASNVASAACQYTTSFYLMPTGELYAAGNSDNGQSGLGSWPYQILTWSLTASGVSKAIPGYKHSFYIAEDGVLYGVGRNGYGQLGLNFTSASVEGWTPSATDAVTCVVGRSISMYIDTNGVICAAGTLKAIFGLGDSSGISTWTQVATNAVYACFCGGCVNPTGAFYVDTNGDLYAIGENWLGNLGTGDTEDLADWTLVASNVASVAGAQSHSMYLSTTGDLYATGSNYNGQLGTGDTDDRVEWTLVATNVASFALPDYDNSFYIDTSGRLFGVGSNYSGVLGLGDDTPRLTWAEITIL